MNDCFLVDGCSCYFLCYTDEYFDFVQIKGSECTLYGASVIILKSLF